MKRIAIFASGNGSNAENIARHFENSDVARVTLILSNHSDAKVLERAEKLNITSVVFNKEELEKETKILQFLEAREIDFIVLAGFLLKVPAYLLHTYPDRVINIHPSLLPKYGGKGMYGMRIHEKVIANGDPRSGISIHLVNENYDEGPILFQVECTITEKDTAETLAKKVHELEYKHYPKIIESIIRKMS